MPSNLVNAMTDIRTLVIASIVSEGNVGSNVFIEGGVHDDPPFPYIVLENEGDSDEGMRTHDGNHNAEMLEFSVHIHTRGRAQGLQLRDLIVNAIGGFSGVQDNTTFGSIHRSGGTHFYNSKLKSNEEIIDFDALLTNN